MQRLVLSTLSVALMGLWGCPKGAEPAPSKEAPKTSVAAKPAAGQGEAGSRLDPKRVIATWNGGQMTYGELLELKSGSFKKFQRQKQQELHKLEQREAEGHIIEMLVKKEADKAGKTSEAYMQGLMQGAEISDAEIEAFYKEKVAQSGQPLEQVKDRIKAYLSQTKSQEVVRKEIDRLKAEAKLSVDIPPPEAAKVSFDLAGRPMKGKPDAKITVVEFSDFECPYCARAISGVEDLVKAFPNDVKVYFLHFPLSFHKKAMPAAMASYCAQQQNKFWEYHDKVFQNQQSLNDVQLMIWASEVGLDAEKYKGCMADPKTKAFVEADMKQGEIAGVQGTPSFFVNGVQHQGVPTVDAIKKLVAKGS